MVEPQAVFTGMEVMVDGVSCAQAAFVGEHAVHHPELGCRIEVCKSSNLHPWHRSCDRGGFRHHSVLVNFHGQVLGFDHRPVSEHHLHYLVDLTSEPAGIRLLLPARTRLVENQAFEELLRALEVEAFHYLQRRGEHRLPFKEYRRARELGIELPEATPTFTVGLLSGCSPPEPAEVSMPKDFPLAQCYRFDPEHSDGTEADEPNAHLLAALGSFDERFVPVGIQTRYNGYSWADLPGILKVEVQIGKELQSRAVWSGTLTCAESLEITVHTSDEKVFSSPVCMAPAPPPEEAPTAADDHLLVTPEAQLCRLMTDHRCR